MRVAGPPHEWQTGLQLVDELGEAEQERHRAEGLAAEVAVEPGRDDARAARDELLHRVDDRRLEELRLVDADRVVAVGAPQRVLARRRPRPRASSRRRG